MAWSSTWESVDKVVKKEVLDKGVFSKKPTDKSICDILIENVETPDVPSPLEYAKRTLNSEILACPQKEIVIGSCNSRIDREIERALCMMFLSERSLITVNLPPMDETSDKAITVKFVATLKNMKLYKQIWEWPAEEKFETAAKLKEEGKTLFKLNRCVDAFFKFSKACKILIALEPLDSVDIDPELKAKVNDLRVILYNNMAECHSLRGNYAHTIKLCTKVLERDPYNVKALYRRAVAYDKERNFERAVEDIRKVLEKEPNNKKATEQLRISSAKLRQGNMKANEMARKMINEYVS